MAFQFDEIVVARDYQDASMYTCRKSGATVISVTAVFNARKFETQSLSQYS